VVLVCVLQTIQMIVHRGIRARNGVPWALVLVGVLQAGQMAVLRGVVARGFVPSTTMRVCEGERSQLTPQGGQRTSVRGHGAAVLVGIGQARKVAVLSSGCAGLVVPLTLRLVEEFQTMKVPVRSGGFADSLGQDTTMSTKVLNSI